MNTRQTAYEPLPASALFAVLGDNAPARDLTASKTADCIKRDGSQITGFVVTDQWGGIGIIDKSAVRWLTNKEMWWLMHDSAQIGNNLDTANVDVLAPAGEKTPTKQ
jgi:hypothetical protein